jgi:GT2 family glycosyltransferase
LNLSEYEFAQYDIYKIPENLFWPGAINLGARQTDKQYLLFCDPDIFYTENWLDNLLDCYNRHKNVGVVSAKLLIHLTIELWILEWDIINLIQSI